MVIWAAHIYANKERRLDSTHEIIVPVVPGMVLATGLVVLGNDLGTALVLFALLFGLAVGGRAPRRFFTIMFSVVGVGLLVLVATNAERLGRVTNFLDPFDDYHDRGWQPAHGLYALVDRRLFGEGIGASQQKWGDLPEAHTDFIFAVLGEELGLAGTLLVDRAVPDHRLRGPARRAPYRRPVRALRLVRPRGLAGRPDDHQRRHGARAAAR